MQIDSQTVLKSVIPDNDGITYLAQTINFTKEEIDADEFGAYQKPYLVSSVCSTKEVRETQIDNGFSVSYLYQDSRGVEFYRVKITPEDCERFDMDPGEFAAASEDQLEPT